MMVEGGGVTSTSRRGLTETKGVVKPKRLVPTSRHFQTKREAMFNVVRVDVDFGTGLEWRARRSFSFIDRIQQCKT